MNCPDCKYDPVCESERMLVIYKKKAWLACPENMIDWQWYTIESYMEIDGNHLAITNWIRDKLNEKLREKEK